MKSKQTRLTGIAVRAVLASGLVISAISHAAESSVAAAGPQVFAPGVISGPAHDSAPAFTPDGNTVYFGRSSAAQSTILVSQRAGSGWSVPQIAPFSGEWNDMEPAMAPDGSYLVFVSNRPASASGAPIEGKFNGGAQKGGNIWRVDRRGEGWNTPVRLPDAINTNTTTFAPSLAADGSVWFMTTDATSGKFRLYRSQYRNGAYEPAVALPFSDGSVTDVDPAVAPDESFVVFGSGRVPKRGIDLFIAFRDNGHWSEPVWLGDVVNSPGSDAEARLSPDHRTLYFSSERTVPVTFPRSRTQAIADHARMQAWDNGNYNIWSVSLAPWLDAHRTGVAISTIAPASK
ncbi:hypothetical protein [Dokdonella soli]|uniref:WD40-like Beta Propeller Repeat n=1 Tax=Dokdonella soli TaxID=529810 RepID=A0ABN1ICJ6_9GAMM